MSEVRYWHHMIPCCEPEEMDFNFSSEDEYWDRYDLIIDTIASLSVHLTAEDGSGDLHQVFCELPLRFEEWEDEE